MNDTLGTLGLLPLAERKLQLGRPRRIAVSAVILLGCIILAATEVVPPEVSFTGGAVLAIVFNIISPREAYEAVDWPILVLLGALIPVGEAMRTTGTTDLIASWITAAASS